MVINPISVQGEITRAQDFSTIKQNDDNKPMFNQMAVQKQNENETQQKAQQVRKKEDTENAGKKYDAKEKGNGQYSGDGGRSRKKASPGLPEGKVIIKGQPGFDMKI